MFLVLKSITSRGRVLTIFLLLLHNTITQMTATIRPPLSNRKTYRVC